MKRSHISFFIFLAVALVAGCGGGDLSPRDAVPPPYPAASSSGMAAPLPTQPASDADVRTQ